jgi:hypothetical protein
MIRQGHPSHFTPSRDRALQLLSGERVGGLRGDTEDQIKIAYCCPIHGRFEVLVPRNMIPDAVEYRHWTPDHGIFKDRERRVLSSQESSGGPSAISIVRVSHGRS